MLGTYFTTREDLFILEWLAHPENHVVKDKLTMWKELTKHLQENKISPDSVVHSINSIKGHARKLEFKKKKTGRNGMYG